MEPSRTKTRRSNDKNWFSSNKATNLIAIAALLASVLLSSPAFSLYEKWSATPPEADFVSPNSSLNAIPAGFLVSVKSNNIPDSSDLWFIVRSGSQAEWYPWALMSSNETWSLENVCPGTGEQILQVWLVPDSQESVLLEYVSTHHSSYTQGLLNLGSSSASELTHRNIYVTKKCPG
jgi:hypothetical protein